MADEFRVCLVCGYERGFHSTFINVDEKIRHRFICPDCGSIYDLGIVEDRILETDPVIIKRGSKND